MTSSSSGADDPLALHQQLIDSLQRAGFLRNQRAEAAFRAVPRHLFLPDLSLGEIYSDRAISTKRLDGQSVSSSSQPTIMAIMLEQLDVQPGHRVLEIGAGTGYNAALLAHLVGKNGHVVTLDIDEDIVVAAREHLATAGFSQVQVLCADGAFGYAQGAPYDRIILTVAAGDIAPAWREQLWEGGRLVLPLALRANVQKAVAFERSGGLLTSVSAEDCGFIPLRGAFALSRVTAPLGPEPGLAIVVDEGVPVDAEAVYALLTGPSSDLPTPVTVTTREIWAGLELWLAVREPRLCELRAVGPLVELGLVPCLVTYPGSARTCVTSGLLGDTGLCVLARTPGEPHPADDPLRAPPTPLWVRSFGSDDALARHLVQQVTAWHAARRPSSASLRIRAYPLQTPYTPAANEIVLDKQWNRLVLDWPQASRP